MAIEAEWLMEPERTSRGWHVAIRFTDTDTGKTRVKHEYLRGNPGNADAKRLAVAAVQQRAETESHSITIPVGTTMDVTPDPVVPPTPPTQDEIDEAAWFADWRTLNKMQQLFAVLPATSTVPRQNAMLALVASLEAGFKNSYLEKI